MKLTPWKTLAAGAGLILLANALALGGVYLDRKGEADSRLTLSQRELVMPRDWSMPPDNSGLALTLNWRVIDADAGDYYNLAYGFSGGVPEWLDAAHMTALGFDAAAVVESDAGHRRYERQLPREVLLVLELAGPAWQQALERARRNAARNEAARLANADSKEFVEKAKRAQEQAKREENQNSRLFAIDAGLDRASLRGKYPDRSRYLILKSTLRPRLVKQGGKTVVTGYLGALAVTRINVPHALRPQLEPELRKPRRTADDPAPRFEATVAVGQRLEPWLESVRVPR